MTEKLDFYKCNVCSNFVEVVLPGEGELVCCGEPMEKLIPKTEKDEMLNEKHVPLIIHHDDGIEVRIGAILHPMEEHHYIQFLELNSPDKMSVTRRYFNPGEEPVYKYVCEHRKVEARELCNIHGLFEARE